MSLIHAVRCALEQNRFFDAEKEITGSCGSFPDLLHYLPELFQRVDKQLFGGAISDFMHANKIPFSIVASEKGPAGLTTFDEKSGMQIHINSHGWVSHFPAMVGGTLCNKADVCLVKVFLHEFIHVLLFNIFLQLDFSLDEIKSSFNSHYDHTHNVLFMHWLACFFGQDTIDNSLLLHLDEHSKPKKMDALTFNMSVRDIEKKCVRSYKKGDKLEAWLKDTWVPVDFVEQLVQKPHFSRILFQSKSIDIPSGLLRCHISS